MKTLFPSAYMTVRAGTILNILKYIPENKASFFIPEEINAYEEKSGVVKKHQVLQHCVNLGIISRINGHYKINLQDEEVEELYKARRKDDSEKTKLHLQNILIRDELIRKILDKRRTADEITLNELRTIVLSHYGIQRVHREQLKFIFGIMGEAGLGVYYKFDGKLSFKKSSEALTKFIQSLVETPKSMFSQEVLTSSSKDIVIKVTKGGEVIATKKLTDKKTLSELFTKEELSSMFTKEELVEMYFGK